MASRRWRAWIVAAALLGAGLSARAEDAPDFATRVIPVLTKAGCNAGSCHGAALGRGGFRLSLLGYDPGADHDSLVHEFEGRRVNTARPERSLVLKKGSAAIEHEGGPRLAAGGEGYRVLRDWIAAGRAAVRDVRRAAWRSSPRASVLARTGQTVPLRVTARYDDGSREDVTRWAVYTPADPEAVRCSGRGEVTALRQGTLRDLRPVPRGGRLRHRHRPALGFPAEDRRPAAGEFRRRPRQPDPG